jgi:GcrA cell cycle regulator
MNHPWTDEEEAILRKLWPAGQSATEISRVLRNRTRAAVIGRVHRLGIADRKSPEVRAQPSAPAVKRDRYAGNSLNARSGKPKKVNPFDLTKSKSDSTPEQRAKKAAAGRSIIQKASDPANDNSVPMVGRSFGQCAWPVGTPARAADQLACGAPIYQGIEKCSYCLDHAQRAFALDITQPKPKENLERANRRWAA